MANKFCQSLGSSLHRGSTVPVFGPSLRKISFVRVYCTSMVATGQEIVRGNKISSRSGKVIEFHLESGKI